jgi:L-lactate dehydrogenase (cytochrome)
MLSGQEVAKHNSRQSCWVVIKGKAYDLTTFLDDHPGGANSILRYGGKDATEEYELLHAPGTIEKTLSQGMTAFHSPLLLTNILVQHLGLVEPGTMSSIQKPVQAIVLSTSKSVPINFCVNLEDIELAAQKVISRRAWTYFHSAADSLQSLQTNHHDWKKISFRPRVLRNVARVNMQRTIMGQKSRLPFFIAPAAMAKLAHKDGELCLARGAAIQDIPYCTSSYSSVSHKDIAACMAEREGGCLFFQLYVSRTRAQTMDLIALARKLDFKALVVTVDTPVVGKREEDERHRAEVHFESGVVEMPRALDPSPDKEAPILRGVHSSTLDWEDLKWIREAWEGTGPVVLKGIQTAEDAKRAAEIGVDGIYLSNHGGRQIDYGPSSIRTLLEIRTFCPEILSKVEIYLDGGIRRGADVLKALCLGATAVSLGRPFMYALGAYGSEGVVKAIQSKLEYFFEMLLLTDAI